MMFRKCFQNCRIQRILAVEPRGKGKLGKLEPRGVCVEEAACSTSHVNIWRRMQHARHRPTWFIVFEDDSYSPEPSKTTCATLVNLLQYVRDLDTRSPEFHDIDFINLGAPHCALQPNTVEPPLSDGTRMIYIHRGHTPTTHAYMLRSSACKRWSEIGNRLKFDVPIDRWSHLNGSLLNRCAYITVVTKHTGDRHYKKTVGLFSQNSEPSSLKIPRQKRRERNTATGIGTVL